MASSHQKTDRGLEQLPPPSSGGPALPVSDFSLPDPRGTRTMWHLVTQPRTLTRLPRRTAEAQGPHEGASVASTRAWGPRFLSGALCHGKEERLFLPFLNRK